MRAWHVASSLIALAGIGAASFVACDTSEACTFTVDGCGGTKDAGPDGSPQQWPPGCDPNADPGDSLPCVDESVALFVAPRDKGGSEGGTGTKASPVSSLRLALDKVGVRPRIYVCGGNYEEAVTINRRANIFGGFDCAGNNWTVPKNAPVATAIVPKEAGPALTITAVSEAITLSDLSFRAQAATSPGGSSIAAWIRQSTGVTLKRVTLTASDGQDAVPGGARDPYTAPAPNGVNAQDGGIAVTNTCPAPLLASKGAAGGAGSATATADGGTGEPPLPPDPVGSFPSNGFGGDSNIGSCGGPAHPGAYGSGGVAGEGAAVPGRITTEGWVPEPGAPGGNGETAQGGGGGAGYTQQGGGGGAGGCGGLGGNSGPGGGSSIALLILDTPVTLTACTLTAGAGKNGGKGGPGQVGQLGSAQPGSGAAGSESCAGANGGIGGSGGGGGGGAGGWSIGVGYRGPAPTIDGRSVTDAESAARVTLGGKGNGGLGGDLGKAAKETNPNPSHAGKANGKPGLAGSAKAVVAVP